MNKIKAINILISRLLVDGELKGVPVLIFANKQDLVHALEADEIVGKIIFL